MLARVVLSIIVMIAAFGAETRAESAFFGLNESAREGQRLEFEQWLKYHLTSSIQPMAPNSKLLITVRATLKTEKDLEKRKVELSKLDIVDVSTDIDFNQEKNFFRKIQAVEITIAHDETLSEESLEGVKRLAKKLVPLVTPWRIQVAALKLAPGPMRQIVSQRSAEQQPMTHSVESQQASVGPVSHVAEARQLASVGNEATPESGNWLRDYQILLGLLFATIGIVAAAYVANRSRQHFSLSPDAIETVKQARERSHGDYQQSAAYVAQTYASSQSSDEVIEVRAHAPSVHQSAAIELEGPELAFNFPQEVVAQAFAELNPELKLVLISSLEPDFREHFLSKVAPRESKLGQFLGFELARLKGNPIEWQKVASRRQESYAAFSNAAFGAIEANESLRYKVQPIIDDWRSRHRTSDGAA